jgi:hypothetical protein
MRVRLVKNRSDARVLSGIFEARLRRAAQPLLARLTAYGALLSDPYPPFQDERTRAAGLASGY